jgi:hypothetical protein
LVEQDDHVIIPPLFTMPYGIGRAGKEPIPTHFIAR